MHQLIKNISEAHFLKSLLMFSPICFMDSTLYHPFYELTLCMVWIQASFFSVIILLIYVQIMWLQRWNYLLPCLVHPRKQNGSWFPDEIMNFVRVKTVLPLSLTHPPKARKIAQKVGAYALHVETLYRVVSENHGEPPSSTEQEKGVGHKYYQMWQKQKPTTTF